MTNFDDRDSPQGWYYFIMRDWHAHRWWIKSQPALGESPFSALCDSRFEAVHAALETRTPRRG